MSIGIITKLKVWLTRFELKMLIVFSSILKHNRTLKLKSYMHLNFVCKRKLHFILDSKLKKKKLCGNGKIITTNKNFMKLTELSHHKFNNTFKHFK